MNRITKTNKYSNFVSWDPRYKGSFDQEEVVVYNYFFMNKFRNKSDGFIIDIGANDGVTISHSLPFIDKGWSALMIEPNPVLFEKMNDLYSDLDDVICINKAVGDSKLDSLPLFLGKQNHQGHSTIVQKETQYSHSDEYFSGEKIEVQCDTLINILIENKIQKHIDILHIDAEGKTLDILKSFDFEEYRPSFLSVDILTQDFDPNGPELKSLMKDLGYKFILSQGQSIWRNDL